MKYHCVCLCVFVYILTRCPIWSVMVSDINSKGHKTPEKKIYAHTYRWFVTISVTVGLNYVTLSLDHTLLMLSL